MRIDVEYAQPPRLPRREPLNDSEPDPIAVMIDRAVAGCCGDYAWRGHYCEYHRGYVEGLHTMAERNTDA